MTEDTSRELIADRYEVVRQIGRGSGGAVWLAQDSLLGRHVAIKQIGAFPGESEGDTRRAIREARRSAQLNHPNVVAVYDVVEFDEVPWLVMEYVDGPTLASAISERGPMAQVGAADMGAQLAAALSAAHRAGVVHGDIKPTNVLIGEGRPKISDFGIARSNVERQFTQVGVAMGTPNYVAPEVAVGGKQTGSADVWSLGATLYYAIEGRDAFPLLEPPLATLQYIATNPPRTPQRAGALEPVLADMLSRDPTRRGSMATISRRLEHLAAGERARITTSTGAPTARRRDEEGGSAPVGASAAGRAGAAAAAGAAAGVAGAGVAAGAASGDEAGDAGARSDDARDAAADGTSVGGPSSDGGSTVEQEPDEAPQMHMVTEAPRSDGGSTIAWVVAIILALLLAALAVGIVGIGEDEGGSSGASSSETSEEAEEDAGSSEDGVNFVERAGAFVERYYTGAPEDPEKSWNMLTPAAQKEKGSQEEFEEFWAEIEKVETSDVAVNPNDGKVTLKVTYHKKDGKTETAKAEYTVKRVDGGLMLDT